MNTHVQTAPSKLPSIKRLKTRAKAMKKASTLTQTQCLDALAQQYGFANWSAFVVAAPSERGDA
ncbi:hypothetical protein SAMN05518800_1788 [Variovorax sp. YR752]|uniref:glyoxalase superfamily protein n=1 Tax=Variovorax sp. YR752 TaxID=1884383 RepID=UPI000BDD5C35|nr:glyoxalase superfamily protein [Variovorax sp. YR752]SOD25197.1 hypothetical protein SAMN05518800_1788 [Variovorax sp. YR752]